MGDQVKWDSQQPMDSVENEVTGKALEGLRERQRGRCHYTGDELTLENVSLDHLIPLSSGGEHSMENVVLCTRQVNRMKGRMTEIEFIDACRRVAEKAGQSVPKFLEGTSGRTQN